MHPTFDAERLLTHIRALAEPRPAGSAAERRAAQFVMDRLTAYGLADVQQQEFKSTARLSAKATPAFLIIAAGLLVGLRRGRLWQVVGGLLASIGGLNLANVWRLRPMPWESAFRVHTSQNVLGRIPASADRRRRVVILAHLDSSPHRLSAHPRLTGYFPLVADGSIIGAVVGGLLSVVGILWPLRALGGLGMLFGAGALLADEANGESSGANDNASGVAVALIVADALRAEPLQHTELWLAFTGAEQAGANGVLALVEQHGEAFSDALFINLKAVGAGELAWATREGLGILSSYGPRFGLLPVAERAAAAHPELGIMGKPMNIIDDLTVIQDWGFSGITLTGYDRVTGEVPNLHRASDTLEALQPETLVRAAQFVREILLQIDND